MLSEPKGAVPHGKWRPGGLTLSASLPDCPLSKGRGASNGYTPRNSPCLSIDWSNLEKTSLIWLEGPEETHLK